MRRLPSKSRRLLSLSAALALAACGGGDGPPNPPQDAGPTLDPVPARGQAATLDVGAWNVEWFGDRSNGPAAETQQQENVRAVLAGVDLDLWGIEEVVDAVAFQRVVANVPGFTALVANDPTVTGGSAYYGATEQKVAFVYRSAEVQVQSAAIILGAQGAAGGPFAGRPPLEVKVRVSPGGAAPQDLVVIVVHLKAFADADGFTRRSAASVALKDYLDTTYPTQRVFVVGDFNDDLDASITAGQPSPFANFVQDSADYTFATQALTLAGQGTTASYPDPIDHHLLTNEQAAKLVPGSVEALRVLESSFTSYADSTSDHYPVVSRYTP